MGFALLRDTLTIRELSFPALGLVLPTASPSALGTTVSKTPPTAAELPPGWFSRGCLLTLSWPIGISLRFPSLLWGNLKEGWSSCPVGSWYWGLVFSRGSSYEFFGACSIYEGWDILPSQVLWEVLLSCTISLTCTNDYKTAVSWHLDFIGCQALSSSVGGEEERQQESKLSHPEFADADF